MRHSVSIGSPPRTTTDNRAPTLTVCGPSDLTARCPALHVADQQHASARLCPRTDGTISRAGGSTPKGQSASRTRDSRRSRPSKTTTTCGDGGDNGVEGAVSANRSGVRVPQRSPQRSGREGEGPPRGPERPHPKAAGDGRRGRRGQVPFADYGTGTVLSTPSQPLIDGFSVSYMG